MRQSLLRDTILNMSQAKRIVMYALFGNRQMDADIRRSIESAEADELRGINDAADGGSKRAGDRELAWYTDFHGAKVTKSSSDFSG